MHTTLLAAVALGAVAHADTLLVAPDAVLRGDPIGVRIEGVEPGERVLITCERRRRSGLFRSGGLFVADADGAIDLASDRPIVGTWDGVDPAGLFWSIADSGEDNPADLEPLVYRVRVDVGCDGSVEHTRDITLLRAVGELVEIPVGDGLPGAFLLRPAGDDPLPCVIAMGGSECGDSAARDIATVLASRGYAVLGLPYCASARSESPIEGLPTAFAEIPIDALETARDWLLDRPDVLPDAIGLWGVSKGAELALAGAARIEGFGAVVAFVPSDVIWEGWGVDEPTSSFSWRGEALPYVPYLGMGEEFSRLGRGQPARIRTAHDAGRLANPDTLDDARIDVGAIDEPVMVVGGDRDPVWDSGDMTRNIAETREAAGLQTVLIVDQEAGHFLSGDVFSPLDPPEARVRARAFPAMLAFFDEHLRGKQ
ncbi:MAG: acyl-CoA thioesterase/BAAT N-terminal domain-containing protein [Planctomycetota bacterium]